MTKIYKPVSEKYITSSAIYYTRGDQRIPLNELLDNLFTLLDNFYPVGCIYISVNNTNPGPIFGGTWERINDTFLLSAGDKYTAGTTGGEETHTLTVEEMPKHSHDMDDEVYGNYKNRLGIRGDGGGGKNLVPNMLQTTGYSRYKPTNTGGGKPHNNMPPYLVVYMWKRTA